MKLKTRKLIFVLLALSCVFANISIGFSSWIVLVSDSTTQQVDIYTEDVVNIRDAFSINTKGLKMGKYLYEEENGSSINGSLTYNFTVDINKLPSYMVNEDASCNLTFSGDLSFSDSTKKFFTSEYISAVCFTNSAGTTSVDVRYEQSKLALEPFNLTITPTDNMFSITFTFTQKCILDDSVKEVLTNNANYFKLSLICGGN